jgi:hypothetical protein
MSGRSAIHQGAVRSAACTSLDTTNTRPITGPYLASGIARLSCGQAGGGAEAAGVAQSPGLEGGGRRRRRAVAATAAGRRAGVIDATEPARAVGGRVQADGRGASHDVGAHARGGSPRDHRAGAAGLQALPPAVTHSVVIVRGKSRRCVGKTQSKTAADKGAAARAPSTARSPAPSCGGCRPHRRSGCWGRGGRRCGSSSGSVERGVSVEGAGRVSCACQLSGAEVVGAVAAAAWPWSASDEWPPRVHGAIMSGDAAVKQARAHTHTHTHTPAAVVAGADDVVGRSRLAELVAEQGGITGAVSSQAISSPRNQNSGSPDWLRNAYGLAPGGSASCP